MAIPTDTADGCSIVRWKPGTVLLAMDFQNGIAGRFAETALMDRVREAVAHARNTGNVI